MSNKKRDSRQYIVINEERLISEVQQRPILYDKALKGYRKPTIREHAWQEVANYLESTVEESKKRWRSLRDAFMKQYKQFSSDEPSSCKKKKWLFYDQMEFLRPYLEMTNDGVRDEYIDDFIQPKHVMKQEYRHDEPKPHVIKTIIHRGTAQTLDVDAGDGVVIETGTDIGGEAEVEEDEQLEQHEEVIDMYEDDRDIISEMFIPHSVGSGGNVVGTISAGNHETHTLVTHHHHHQPHQQQQHQQQQQSHQQQQTHHQQQHQPLQAQHHNHQQNSSNNSTDDVKEQSLEVTSVSAYGLDPDERFLLSCSPILKRLSHKKNALARLKMQQILYDIEFGEDY